MANNTTSHDFLVIFDEFKSVAVQKIDALIAICSVRVNIDVWGVQMAPYATMLLVAHILTMTGRSGAGPGGGALTAEAVGDLSRGYATVGVPGSGDQELLTTRYGQEFVALRRETIPMGTLTGPPTSMPPQVC